MVGSRQTMFNQHIQPVLIKQVAKSCLPWAPILEISEVASTDQIKEQETSTSSENAAESSDPQNWKDNEPSQYGFCYGLQSAQLCYVFSTSLCTFYPAVTDHVQVVIALFHCQIWSWFSVQNVDSYIPPILGNFAFVLFYRKLNPLLKAWQ